jgi:hypothetical protein
MIDVKSKNAQKAIQLHIDSRDRLLRVALLLSEHPPLAQSAIHDAVAAENEKIASVADSLRPGNKFPN